MQRPRHKLLTRSALAINQYTPIGGRSQRDLLPQRFHRHAVPQYFMALFEFRAKPAIFRFQAHVLERVSHHQYNLVERKRFFDEIKRAEFRRTHGRLDISVPGDHDHNGRRFARLNRFERGQSIRFRQPHVEQHQIEAPPLDLLQAGFAR